MHTTTLVAATCAAILIALYANTKVNVSKGNKMKMIFHREKKIVDTLYVWRRLEVCILAFLPLHLFTLYA